MCPKMSGAQVEVHRLGVTLGIAAEGDNHLTASSSPRLCVDTVGQTTDTGPGPLNSTAASQRSDFSCAFAAPLDPSELPAAPSPCRPPRPTPSPRRAARFRDSFLHASGKFPAPLSRKSHPENLALQGDPARSPVFTGRAARCGVRSSGVGVLGAAWFRGALLRFAVRVHQGARRPRSASPQKPLIWGGGPARRLCAHGLRILKSRGAARPGCPAPTGSGSWESTQSAHAANERAAAGWRPPCRSSRCQVQGPQKEISLDKQAE
ncbi:uncharacterized protein LOC131515232 [Neofelis nebulosa]|uniref:uncharacterized protein LOC131515232 n=1 Tax=Neofelis nebulosa TaxID=61452 RepID=UPI00272ABEB3|nr:uncharacterized protein LOC131515232 [Neofelis nebulosa]